MVDGEWRKLEVISETIKVKGQEDQIFKIKKTHRGPVIPFKHLQFNTALLFGGECPKVPNPGMYSFGWGL